MSGWVVPLLLMDRPWAHARCRGTAPPLTISPSQTCYPGAWVGGGRGQKDMAALWPVSSAFPGLASWVQAGTLLPYFWGAHSLPSCGRGLPAKALALLWLSDPQHPRALSWGGNHQDLGDSTTPARGLPPRHESTHHNCPAGHCGPCRLQPDLGPGLCPSVCPSTPFSLHSVFTRRPLSAGSGPGSRHTEL